MSAGSLPKSLAIAAWACFAAACPAGAPSTDPGGVCHSAGQSCTTSADCCTGFDCVSESCQFVGGDVGGGGGSSTEQGSTSSGSGGTTTQQTHGGTTGADSSFSSSSNSSATFGSSTGGSESSSEGSTSGGFSFSSSPGSSTSGGGSSHGSTTGAESSSVGGSSTSGAGSSTSGSGGSTSGGGGGSCATLVSGEHSTCTPGDGTCVAPLQCLFDPDGNDYLCLNTCNVTADCPDIATHCVGGSCVDNPCGGVGDGGVDYGGTLSGPCDANGVNDGTCVPEPGYNSPGVCLQTGGTATGACNSFTRCTDASELCETGWACRSTSGSGGPGTCEELCTEGQVDACPSPETCQAQSDGLSLCAQPSAPSDGGTGVTCDLTTCGGCPSGETCMCVLGSSLGTVPCGTSATLCTFLGSAGIPGVCQ